MFTKLRSACVLLLYACALLQFVRYYVKSTTPYLNMTAYLHGHERLPFQERVLPILLLKPLTESAWAKHHLLQAQGSVPAGRVPVYLLSLAALLVASLYAQQLYKVLTDRGVLRLLVFPLFLFTVMWTYAIHSEADFFYPYDLLSLAFFTAGLYYIFRRQFLPLLLVVLIGTFNRETTLFLIVVFMLVEATDESPIATSSFRLRQVPWARASVLAAVWLAIKFSLSHHFAGNDRSEDFLRLRDNLHQLRPRLVPALLNLCGYMLPLVLLFARSLRPVRLRNSLWVFPIWVLVMLGAGVLVETRIYGELCGLTAVAAVLLLEQHAERRLLWDRARGGETVAAN